MTSHNEEEYFARETVEKLRRLHKEQMKKVTPEQAAKLKQTHFNRCPSCGMELQELPAYKGVVLLQCFNCGGAFVPPEAQHELKRQGHGKEHAIVDAILNWIRHDHE